MKRHFYPAIFTQELDGYSVKFPDLEGVFTEGDTMDEAYEMSVDAIGLFLLSEENRLSLPNKNINELKNNISDNEFLILIEFDEASYLKKHSTHSIKKTLTIPSWLNEMALKDNINFSQVLQDGLKNQLGI